MSKPPFIPSRPYIEFLGKEDIEKFENMTPAEREALKHSDAYQKARAGILKRHKEQKRLKRQDWWWNKGIQILNLVLALIAAITGILALILR